MSQSTWTFAATNPATGAVVDFMDVPSGFKLTRRLDDYCEVEGTINNPRDLQSLAAFTRALLVQRNGNPVFHGRVAEPFKRSPRSREFIAKDPYHNMAWRRVRSRTRLTGQPDEISKQLIDDQNAYFPTGLVHGGDYAWGDSVQRTFHAGDTVGEKIDFMRKTHGNVYHFRINAREGIGGDLSAIETFSTIADKPSAKFEYGEGTHNNCVDYDVEEGQVLTRASVISEKGSVRSAEADDIVTYGLWEDERGHVTSNDLDHLAAVSSSMLVTSPPLSVVLQPGPDAPRLFNDFDVGTHVRVRINEGGYYLRGTALVTEVVLAVEENSAQEVIETIEMKMV